MKEKINIVLSDSTYEINTPLSIIPLRNMILLPYTMTSIIVGRDFSNNAIEEAKNNDNYILCVTQKKADIEDPTEKDFYNIGVIGKINKIVKTADEDAKKVVIQGIVPVKIKELTFNGEFWQASFEPIILQLNENDLEEVAYLRKAISLFKEFVRLSSIIPEEILYNTYFSEHLEF